MLKRHGGKVGLSQDDTALDRLVTTTPLLARIVRKYLNGFPELKRRMNKASTISFGKDFYKDKRKCNKASPLDRNPL